MKKELGVAMLHRFSATDESKQGRNSCPVVAMEHGLPQFPFHAEPAVSHSESTCISLSHRCVLECGLEKFEDAEVATVITRDAEHVFFDKAQLREPHGFPGETIQLDSNLPYVYV